MERINFEMCGLLSMAHETENFKPYEEKATAKGNGKMFNLNFNVQMLGKDNNTNGNQQMMRLSTYMPNDMSGKTVYVYINDGYDAKTKKFKGHSEQIAWERRNDVSIKKKASEISKYIVDLEVASRRKHFRYIEKALEEGKTPMLNDLKEVGLEGAETDAIKEALEKSNKKRFEFLSEYDFLLFVHKLLTEEKYVNAFGDKKFNIRGEHTFSYSTAKGKWYGNFVPQKIYLQDDDAESFARENVVLYYGEDSLDDAEGMLEETGKYPVNGWVHVTDDYSRETMFAPYTAMIAKTATGDTEKDAKADKIRIARFTVDNEDEIKCMGMVVNLWSGAERKEITEDDLSEDQLESILIGDCTLEDIQRELGGVWGDRVNENRFCKLMRGFTGGVQDTTFTREDMNNIASDDDNAFEEAVEDTSSSEDEEDLFDGLL